MGIFDSLKKALGGSGKAEAGVKGPSMVLKEAGIDPSGLDFEFGQGSIGVSGRVDDAQAAERIVAELEKMPGIARVDNRLEIGAAAPAAPAEEAPAEAPEVAATGAVESEAGGEAAVESGAPQAEESHTSDGRSYTVKPGDSLWKIAAEVYGSGGKYTKIFEANRDILDDPDLIMPGQVLKIPDLNE